MLTKRQIDEVRHALTNPSLKPSAEVVSMVFSRAEEMAVLRWWSKQYYPGAAAFSPETAHRLWLAACETEGDE
jgi:hypothetical protein